ncbi:Mis12 protein-domain-containing protein [Emericellopsis atlantica]|uniref:Mis12 protein-domain-containing protein n=1 Tax=Emericellopsis atlantica TaxID=2614577 RepID=A0A9P7ZIM0_9HYPO|nr:Mis12 protein-domain-containing protein [Emericellopsis atlantica]KAG9252799.1 Mis12 protein-domain-containing protein [Emericellopsis atlantica]
MSTNSDYELLTEHLGFPPVTLLDDIINTVNVLSDRALVSIEDLLLGLPAANIGFRAGETGTAEDAARHEIENGTHQLETLLTASIDRNFDKLELYAMQNILTVQPRDLRPFVRLAHYQGLDFADDSSADVEGTNALRRRYQASQKVNLALQKQRARNEALLRALRHAVGAAADDRIKVEPKEGEEDSESSTFGFLNERRGLASIGSDTPITTTAQFTLSQLNALRGLSTSLRELIPNLAVLGDEQGTAKSWRRERSEYVEQSSRKYLEKTSGLELGSQGEVRDGEYQGAGRGISKDQVEGFEAVVAMLGDKSAPAGDERMHES